MPCYSVGNIIGKQIHVTFYYAAQAKHDPIKELQYHIYPKGSWGFYPIIILQIKRLLYIQEIKAMWLECKQVARTEVQKEDKHYASVFFHLKILHKCVAPDWRD